MPSIELNHIYTVVNRPTYDAIKNSEFIKEFAHTYEQRNSADGQIGWEGFYIRGKHTFIELFYPQERYKNIGISGIGLGFDHKGSLKECFKSFQKKFSNAQYESFTRNGEAWFNYIAVNGSYYGEGHSLWIMEYSPDSFKENKENISRQHYNATAYEPTKSLQDITGFSIALKPEDQKTLTSYLKQSGMTAVKPNVFINNAGIRIEISNESATEKGIYKINLLLNKTSAIHFIQLGNSQLKIEGKHATWQFN